MGRRSSYHRLEDHPALDDVLAVLAQVPHLSDDDLRALAARWQNTPAVAEARRRALSPDTLLVVDVLRAFDDVSALYADDLSGDADFVEIEPEVVVVALKAVRDAIAGVFARPVLRRSEHQALTAPWRHVFPRPRAAVQDLGPGAEAVQQLLDGIAVLAGRCHDAASAQTFDGLLVRAMTRDEAAREEAVGFAHSAAVLTGRRRLWTLLRRNAAAGLAHRCRSCAAAADSPYDDERVVALCADAACALLMSDCLDPRTRDTLLAPLTGLVPLPRVAT